MTVEEIAALCERLPGAGYDYPFGPQPRCYRVGGRIFAALYPEGVPGALTVVFDDTSIPLERMEPMLLLHCTPPEADFWRAQYPDAVRRPYHSPQSQWPYSNTVLPGRGLPDEVLRDMVGRAYQTVLEKLPKKQREKIRENGPEIK